MKTFPTRSCAVAAAALLFAVVGQAQSETPQTPMRAPMQAPMQMPPQSQAPTGSTQKLAFDQVTIVNSSPDLDEVDRVMRMSAQYPLRVILSGKGGDYYVADRLSLKQRGEVLADVSSAGPVLLMDLPSGNYELEAEFGDRTLRRQVHVTRSGVTVHWVVPNSIN